MKKNRLLIISLLLVSFFTFGLTVKANDCDLKTCYCRKNDHNRCGLYDVKPNYYEEVDKSMCGCKNSGTSGSSKTVQANTDMDFCQNAGIVKSAQIVGWTLFVLKIVAPLLLIIFAMIDLGKAVMSSDDKAISAAVSTLVKRALAAVIIFFVPTIIALVFKIVGNSSEAKNKYSCLSTCISKPSGCKIPANNLFK